MTLPGFDAETSLYKDQCLLSFGGRFGPSGRHYAPTI
jgi:hypothetical protein